jgi:hypothetical protein
MHILTGLSKFRPSYSPVELGEAEAGGYELLSGIERFAEAPLASGLRCCKAPHRLAEEEFCRDIEGQTKEKRLQVDDTRSTVKDGNQVFYALFKSIETLIVLMVKRWSQQFSRMLLRRTFLTENAVTKHG